MQKLFELEKKMLKHSEWYTAPLNVQEIANLESMEGTPTAIAHDEEWGWCVFGTCGQGPFLIYKEN